MQFTDKVTISGTRVRDDGYLVVDAKVARIGIQRYLGSEVGRPELAVVDVYRPESEVFSTDSMASFAHRPVTDDHPSVAVTADNWKQLSVGQTDGDIKRDGDFLRIPLMVADAATIQKVQAGKRELSAGYTCDLKWEKGTTPNGLSYDAIQTNIRANHVAIVQRGRAGSDARIGDDAFKWGTAPITNVQDKETVMNLRTVMVDGLSVETTDQGAQAIDKLQKDQARIIADMAKKEEEMDKKLAKKDADLSALQAKLDDALGKVLDQSAIDKLVSDRVALEARAALIAKDVKPLGLSDAALKTAVVKAKLGDKLPADRFADQAYIDARFDILAEDAGKTVDTFRDARITPPGTRPINVANMSDAQRVRQQAFDALLHFDQTGSELGN
jgi:hypothetical protein